MRAGSHWRAIKSVTGPEARVNRCATIETHRTATMASALQFRSGVGQNGRRTGSVDPIAADVRTARWHEAREPHRARQESERANVVARPRAVQPGRHRQAHTVAGE